MFNLSENSCYLNVVRPPTKSIHHCTSGVCQIQRVSHSNDHANLQYSIKHSKMLQKYRLNYPYTNPFDPKQSEQIFLVKNISQKQSQFYVGKTLKELHCTLHGIHVIQNLKKQKYNSNSPLHENQLIAIWNNLKPKQQLKNRISDQWISIGFQVNDPATDFRGSGYLGLVNLYKFTSQHRGQKAFQVASSPQTQYFFCSAGLFFTILATDLMKAKKIDYSFWTFDSYQQLLNKFQIVYEMLFLQFNYYWLESCPDKSILYFNQNLKNFQKLVKSWSNQMIRGRLQSLQYK